MKNIIFQETSKFFLQKVKDKKIFNLRQADFLHNSSSLKKWLYFITQGQEKVALVSYKVQSVEFRLLLLLPLQNYDNILSCVVSF